MPGPFLPVALRRCVYAIDCEHLSASCTSFALTNSVTPLGGVPEVLLVLPCVRVVVAGLEGSGCSAALAVSSVCIVMSAPELMSSWPSRTSLVCRW
jgi:hypothetical protein